MDSLTIRASLDTAINSLMALAGSSVSEPVKLTLRHAYSHLQAEIVSIDSAILSAVKGDA